MISKRLKQRKEQYIEKINDYKLRLEELLDIEDLIFGEESESE